MPYCASCGKPNGEDAVFCQNCGKKLSTIAAESVSSKSSAKLVTQEQPWAKAVAWLPAELNYHDYFIWNDCQELIYRKSAPGQKTTSGQIVGRKGVLVLSNRRLIFVAKQGLFSKDYALVFSTPLEKIVSASRGRHIISSKLRILFGDQSHRDFIISHMEDAVPRINKAITDRLAEMERERQAEMERERTFVTKHVVIDFSSLRDVIARDGMVVQPITCPSCGKGMQIPSSGQIVTCSYCGTSLKAVDVYEELKRSNIL